MTITIYQMTHKEKHKTSKFKKDKEPKVKILQPQISLVFMKIINYKKILILILKNKIKPKSNKKLTKIKSNKNNKNIKCKRKTN